MRRLVAAFAAPLSLLVAIFACSPSRVPVPEMKPHPKGAAEAVCVPYPPPAPHPEETGMPPEAMGKRAVWVDGEWIWRPRGASLGKWEWQKGGWEDPPYGATYSRGTLERMKNGALVFYPPHWHLPAHYKEKYSTAAPISSEGVPLDCPPPPKPAESANDIHDAGIDKHIGPVLVYPPDAPSSAPPKVVLDAVIPTEAEPPPVLIQPPEK